MTDWFFPDGMNHHELFAGVPGVQSAMQLFARRVAGLGHLPAEGATARGAERARRRAVDVLVVGAGPAGMAAAFAASARGRAVEVVDDALEPGGGARGLRREDDAGLAAIRDAFESAVAAGRVRVRSRTVAAGVFGRDVLVVSASEGPRAEVLEPRALVIAAGAHDGVVPFENNDFPGVLSARAACLLLASGVSVGEKVVILTPSAEGSEPRAPQVSFGDVFARRLEGAPQAAGKARVTKVREVVRVKGGAHLRGVVVREDGRERSVTADALLVDAPRSPAYELCEQAGAALRHHAWGYVPVIDATRAGHVAEGVWAIGEVTGAPLAAEPFVRRRRRHRRAARLRPGRPGQSSTSAPKRSSPRPVATRSKTPRSTK